MDKIKFHEHGGFYSEGEVEDGVQFGRKFNWQVLNSLKKVMNEFLLVYTIHNDKTYITIIMFSC